MSKQILQPEIVEDKPTINIIVRKETNYGRYLYYPVNKEDEWITIIQNQKSLTQDDVAKPFRMQTLTLFSWRSLQIGTGG